MSGATGRRPEPQTKRRRDDRAPDHDRARPEDGRQSATPYRYTAALAARDRGALAGPLGRARAPSRRPTRPARWPSRTKVAGAAEDVRARHVPVPVGHRACTSATRWATSRTDVYGRFKRMTGHNVLHALGYDAFGLPAEQYAVQTGQHPRVTTEANIATMRRQLRRLGLAHDPRRSVATTDPAYYRWTQWIFLQIFNAWYDDEAGRARPIDELAPLLVSEPPMPTGAGVPDGRPWADLDDVERRRRRRRAPAGLPVRGAGQLVPRPGHRAGQRGGHRRRPQRPRQLPGVQAQPAPVDDAHHRLRRPAAGRPGPAGLARVDQAACSATGSAAPRAPGSRFASDGRRDRGLHHPAGHAVRRDVHGAGARAPAGRRADLRRLADRRTDVVDRRSGHAARRGRGLPAAAELRTDLERQTEGREKTGVFTGALRDQPGQRRGRSRSSSPTTC